MLKLPNVWSHQRKMQKQSKMPQMRRVALPINMYKQTCTLPELLRSTLKQLTILPLLFNLYGANKNNINKSILERYKEKLKNIKIANYPKVNKSIPSILDPLPFLTNGTFKPKTKQVTPPIPTPMIPIFIRDKKNKLYYVPASTSFPAQYIATKMQPILTSPIIIND